MSAKEPFYFMLPRLIEQGLLEDDSSHYALVTYPRPVMSSAVEIIVKDLATHLDGIDLKSKKRVKFLMEYLAVALSLKVEQTPLMSAARTVYRKWLENPSLFGDNKRQNKYIRRVLKQLSLPFAINVPTNPDNFRGEFNTLLNAILNDYKYFHTTHGQDFEKETWLTMFNILIGICDSLLTFDFSTLLSKSDSAKLRQKALDVFFSILQLSGLKDDAVWQRFKEYCSKWSKYFDFIHVWGHHSVKLFVFLNLRIYKQRIDTTPVPFSEGVYSLTNPISDEMVALIFHHFLFAIDNKKALEAPDLLKEFATHISILTANAQAIADMQSPFLIYRYSAPAFLKLFGSFLTFSPVLEETFDEAMSLIDNSIISILSNLQIDPSSNEVTRLLSYVVKRSNVTHMPLLASFIAHAGELYRHNTLIIPYVSDLSLNLMAQLNPAKASRVVTDAFFCSAASLFFSASEVSNNEALIKPAFDTLWKLTPVSSVQYQLLSYASKLNIDVIGKIGLFFTESSFKQMTTDSSNVGFLSAVIILIGTMVRLRPNSTTTLAKSGILPQILKNIMKLDATRLQGFEALVISALETIVSCIDWQSGMFADAANISAFFEYVSFLQHQVKRVSKKKGESSWCDKPKHFIQAALSYATGRVNLHMPLKDFFSRTVGADSEICEDYIAKKLGLNEYKINAYTLRGSHLITFIQGPSGADPIAMFSRGPQGKSIFIVNEDVKGEFPDPKLSGEIQKEKLPECVKLAQVEPLIGTQSSSPVISQAELEANDQSLRNAYGKDFSTWLNWNDLGFYYDLEKGSPFQRPRVADFVSQLAILGAKNEMDVRIPKDMTKVKEAMQKIDDLERCPVVSVVINHVLITDSNLSYNPDLHQRMTPLMKEFFRAIAEPISIPEGFGVPKLRTSVPAIPNVRGIVAFISPAMADSDDGAEEIYNMGKESFVRIIFNETDFDIKLEEEKKPKQLVLVVRPTAKGIYHVTAGRIPEEISSPFAAEQTLTAESLAFMIAVCIDQNTRANYKKVMANIGKERKKIIKDLVPDEPQRGLAGVVAEAFAAQQ